jgi:tetratricopeptide (TPR) repeat protein
MAQCAVAWTTPATARSVWLGRERELRELEVGLDELLAGRGGVFLITGEPGIGKTRLADELSRSAVSRGVGVHWGRAWEAGGAPSYWPFIQILRSIVRGLDREALTSMVGPHGVELASLLPELRPQVAGLGESLVHPEADRFLLFDAVNTFLHSAAARAPRLIVFDDLHAADPSVLQLLQFVVRDLRSAPVMVVGTYRDVEARLSREIAQALGLIAREASLLPLDRLNRREVATFIAQATGSAPAEDRVEALHRRSEGNPLFLCELLQLDAPAVHVPPGIDAVIRARLSRLAPDTRSVLEVAAVLGREFDAGVAAAIAEVPITELRARLMPAADAGVVEPVDQAARWRFTHVLLREALYEDVSFERRAALHEAAARTLRGAAGEPALAEIAHHLLHAVPAASVRDAVDAAVRAAERAIRLLAFEDACTLLTRAAGLLASTSCDERQRFEVLLSLGVARIRSGDVTNGKRTCLRACELARSLGDGERLARAVLGLACEYVPGVRDAPLIALLEEALDALPPGDAPLRARCMAQLAAERQPEPDTRQPMELARAAVAMARRTGDTDALRFALSNAGLATLAYGDPGERREIDQETLRLAMAAGDHMAALRAHLLITTDCWQLGDLAGAAAHFRAYEELLQRRHRRYRWVVHSGRALRALWEARFDDAERCWREAVALWREDEGRGVEMIAFPVGFCRAAERYDNLPELEARLRDAFGSPYDDLGSSVCEMLIAQLYARIGDVGRTAAQLRALEAQPVFSRIQEASWLALLAEPAHLLGDAGLAERIRHVLLPRARYFFWLGPLGNYCEPPYSRQLGLVLQTLGRLDEAVGWLTHAEELVTQVGMRSHLARLQYELAGVLLARRGAKDHVRAAALLDQAHALARELGQAALLPPIEQRLDQVRAALGLVAPPDARPPDTFAMRREGDYWTIVFRSMTRRFRDSRGFHLLAQLVDAPGQEFHVLQLASQAELPGGGDAGELLDPKAIRAYRRRLTDVREALDEAERFADTGRAERAREEMDFLSEELARAVGLGGRARHAGGAAERARTAVQKRVRSAIRRIEQELPDLGRHLDQTIRTGVFCGYLPNGRPRAQRR